MVPKKSNKKFKVTKTEQDFQRMKGEINDVKYKATEMLEASKSLPLPLGIAEGVKGAFQCKICRETPIKPAIIKTKCCSSLL